MQPALYSELLLQKIQQQYERIQQHSGINSIKLYLSCDLISVAAIQHKGPQK